MTEDKWALRRSICLLGALLVASSCTIRRDISPIAIAEEANIPLVEPALSAEGPGAGQRSAQSGAEAFAAALGLRHGNKVEEAVAGFKDITIRYPGSVWASRASFLIGIIELEALGDALPYFEAASGVPDIGDYTVYYRGRALAERNEFAEAAIVFDSISTLFPDSRLAEDSSFRKASALLGAGAHLEALTAFSEFMEAYPGSALLPEAILGSARAHIGLGNIQAAWPMLTRVRYRHPLSKASAPASALLADMMDSGADIPEPTDEDIFARAGSLFDGARYKEAIAGYARLKSPGNGYYDRAVMKTAYAQVRLKSYSLADSTLKEYLKGRKTDKARGALSSPSYL